MPTPNLTMPRAARARLPWPAALRWPRAAAVEPSSPLAFGLFLLVNAVLLVRPAEIFPQLQGIELYFYVVIACVIVAAGDVMKFLGSGPIETQPIVLCLAGLFVAVLLPHLVTFNPEEAWKTSFHFFKQVVYFMLLVSLVNTPDRLRTFVRCLLVICAFVVVVALLDYHGLITLPTIRSLQDTEVDRWGEVTAFQRLQFTGILNDPNEVCVWLAALLPLALFNLLRDRNVLRRALWLAVTLLFGYGIFLTRSRGGFLAMVGGLGVMIWLRYGRERAVLLGAVGLPVLLVLFAGRQTSLDATQGTGQSRVQLWSDWMDRFRGSPLVGSGMSFKEVDPEVMKQQRAIGLGGGHVAHNSYLQAFADLGFAGGCLFLGAFIVALWSLWRVGRHPAQRWADPDTRALQPFLFGTATAYCIGMLTLSLWTVAPTYVVLALAAAYPGVCRAQPPLAALRMDVNLLGRFALAGIAFLAGMYVFVRLFVNWG